MSAELWGYLALALATIVAAMIAARQPARRIGKPNGRGDVVTMLTTLLQGHERIEAKLENVEDRVSALESGG